MKIPPTYALCFNTSCPRAATCLRYVAGKETLTTQKTALTVLPHVLQSDGVCEMYREHAKITAAYGFSILLSNVRRMDVVPLREKIIDYLGNQSAYYRYNNGKRLLTPVQQEHILTIFREKGYTDNLCFDNYCETYDFTD